MRGSASWPATMPVDGDRAGVDHRIEAADRFGVEADGIERFAARLHPDLAEDVSRAAVLEASSVDEGFEIDWIVNGWPHVADPVRDPSTVARQIPNHSGFALVSSGM